MNRRRKRAKKHHRQRDQKTHSLALTRKSSHFRSADDRLKRARRQKKERIPDDKRFFRPEYQGLTDVDGRDQRITIVDSKTKRRGFSQSKGRMALASPKRQPVCIRRRRRRQALFAVKRAGKGIAGPRRRRLTEHSDMRC